MSFCSKCGVKVPAESKFCHACGSNIVKPIESVEDEYPELIEPIVHVVNMEHEEEIPQNKDNKQDIGSLHYENGLKYYKGEDVTKDYSKAIELFKEASKMGNSNAENIIGVMYQFGLGVEQNYKGALKWFHLSANKGNPKALYDLGNMFYIGQGIPLDHKEAFKYFKLSSEKGNVEAINILKKMKEDRNSWYSLFGPGKGGAVESSSDHDEDLRTFVGNNCDYYLSKWHSNGGWNWWAFLWTFFWMSYRKMYIRSFLLGSFILYGNFYCSKLGLPDMVNGAFILILGVLGGWKGNYMYKSHVNEKIKEIYALNLSKHNENNQLVRQGGTSKLGLIVMTVLFIFGWSLVLNNGESSSVNNTENTITNSSKSEINHNNSEVIQNKSRN